MTYPGERDNQQEEEDEDIQDEVENYQEKVNEGITGVMDDSFEDE